MSGRIFASVIGRLGADPKFAGSGATMWCRFSVATSRWDSDSKKEETEWWNVVVFGRNAETASKYAKKGSLVCVDGRPEWSSYTGKDGIEKQSLTILGNDLKLLSKPVEQAEQRQQAVPQPLKQTAPADQYSRDDFGEDVPF